MPKPDREARPFNAPLIHGTQFTSGAPAGSPAWPYALRAATITLPKEGRLGREGEGGASQQNPPRAGREARGAEGRGEENFLEERSFHLPRWHGGSRPCPASHSRSFPPDAALMI